MLSLTPGSVIDHYCLQRELGRGGMGTVWLAHDQSLNRPVAMKFLHPEHISTGTYRDRFKNEADLLAQLNTPFFPAVYAISEHAGSPYMVTELLHGHDLLKYLAVHRDDAFGAPEMTWIVLRICAAMRLAHRRNIIHRDLKPSNVFLCYEDVSTSVNVKILDLGVAKSTIGARRYGISTGPGLFLGTPAYASPEQARSSRDADHHSDIYAIVAIFYRLLTSRIPITAPKNQLLEKLASGGYQIVPPSSIVNTLPSAVDDICSRGLAWDKTNRYHSVDDLIDALTALPSTPPHCTSGCEAEHQRTLGANGNPDFFADHPVLRWKRADPSTVNLRLPAEPSPISPDLGGRLHPMGQSPTPVESANDSSFSSTRPDKDPLQNDSDPAPESMTCPDPDPDSDSDSEADPWGILSTIRLAETRAGISSSAVSSDARDAAAEVASDLKSASGGYFDSDWWVLVEQFAHGPFALSDRELRILCIQYPNAILWNGRIKQGIDVQAAITEGLITGTLEEP